MTQLVDDIINKIFKTNMNDVLVSQIESIKQFDKINKLKGLRETTRSGQVKMVLKFGRSVQKRFEDVDRKDIENYLADLNVQPYTLQHNKNILRKFFKIITGGKEYPPCVSWIEPTKNCYKFKKVSDMIIEKEVQSMIDCVYHLQHKCIIGLFWDTAIRCGELVNLNIGDVVNEGEYIFINVDGKTGIRELGLISSAHLINKWLLEHPFKNDRNSPLFISYKQQNFHQRITTYGIGTIVGEARNKAGIQKTVTPHIYRHSRITNWVKKGITESELRYLCGWNAHSNMPEVYIHLSKKDIHNKRIKLETGQVPKEEIKPSILLPVMCPRCRQTNDSTNKYCEKCWLPLHQDAIQRDMKILAMFKSNYAKHMLHLDVDTMVGRYYSFKSEVEEMCQFYKVFNGNRKIGIQELKNKLRWDGKKFNNIMDYLLEGDLVRVDGGIIEIQSYINPQNGKEKTIFDNFVIMQSRYLSPSEKPL